MWREEGTSVSFVGVFALAACVDLGMVYVCVCVLGTDLVDKVVPGTGDGLVEGGGLDLDPAVQAVVEEFFHGLCL